MDVPDAPAGVAPGGLGLPGGNPESVDAPAVPDVSVPAETPALERTPERAPGGVPMMPGPPGPGGGSSDKEAERPDSSALVDGDPQDWLGDDAGGEPGAPTGAAPGGAGIVDAQPPVDPPPPVDPALGWHQGVSVPGIGDTEPVVVMPGFPGASEPPEREKAERPEAAELLVEESRTWAGPDEAEDEAGPQTDDHVPVLQADDGSGDRAAWDDTGQSWWLHGDADEREEKLTDA